MGDVMIARTGYTGEDGFEVVLPRRAPRTLWTRLRAAGVAPCGLGARDTLRLEAGMNLYGQDMDETVSPLESGPCLDGRSREPARFHRQGGAARRIRRARQLVGLVLRRQGRRAARASDRAYRSRRRRDHERHVQPDAQSVDRARARAGGHRRRATRVKVVVRDRELAARVVKPPFVAQRQGAGRRRAMTELRPATLRRESFIDQAPGARHEHSDQLAVHVVARMGAHRSRRHGDRSASPITRRPRSATSSISSCPRSAASSPRRKPAPSSNRSRPRRTSTRRSRARSSMSTRGVTERARAGEPGSVRGLALPAEARRRRRGGEAPRCACLRGDDRRRVMPAFEASAAFVARHIGTTPEDQAAMLGRLGYRFARRADGRDRARGDPAQDAARARRPR